MGENVPTLDEINARRTADEEYWRYRIWLLVLGLVVGTCLFICLVFWLGALLPASWGIYVVRSN